jgi:hypothetical protein
MKTVFSSSREIPHLWAHQTQSHASAGSVSFEGVKFRSYRTVIAQLVKVSRSETVAVFDSCKYSPTTARHQSLALSAVSHLRRYYVRRAERGTYDLTPNASDVAAKLRDVENIIKECAAGSHFARLERIKGIPSRVDEVREFAKIFKLGAVKLSPEIKKALKPETVAQFQARADKAQAEMNSPAAIAKRAKGAAYRLKKKLAEKAADDERRERLRIEAQEKHALHVLDWRAGRSNHIPYVYGFTGLTPTALRLAKDDGRDVVETSMGARVPLSAALKLFRFCEKTRAAGFEFIPAHEFKVGHYALQMITAEGAARIGCHFLAFEEMAALFASLTPEQIAGGANA